MLLYKRRQLKRRDGGFRRRKTGENPAQDRYRMVCSCIFKSDTAAYAAYNTFGLKVQRDQ